MNAEPAPVKSAEIPHWRAVVFYTKFKPSPNAHDYLSTDRLHLRVSHANRIVYDDDLQNGLAGEALSKLFFVRDAPHVQLWAETGIKLPGEDKIYTTTLFDFSSASQPKSYFIDWGYGYKEQVIRGRHVYISGDMSFSRRRAIQPTRVMQTSIGGFVDVTNSFPELLEAEVAEISKIDPSVCVDDERLGAYLADMIRLNRSEEGSRFVSQHGLRKSTVPEGYDVFKKVASILAEEGAMPARLQLHRVADFPPCTQPTPEPSTPRPSASPGG